MSVVSFSPTADGSVKAIGKRREEGRICSFFHSFIHFPSPNFLILKSPLLPSFSPFYNNNGQIMKESSFPPLVYSDEEWISPFEFAFRRAISFGFRLCLGTFCSSQLFDFLFSPIWMHGYLWSLNQPLSMPGGGSLAEKSAASILEHQMDLVGNWERVGHAILSTLGTWMLLSCSGFSQSSKSVWHLLWISLSAGAASGLLRSIQQNQRLYPCIHECFFAFLLIFLNGLCLCLRMPGNEEDSISRRIRRVEEELEEEEEDEKKTIGKQEVWNEGEKAE